MADKIVIGADLDTSDVEKKLSDLQKKVNSFRTGGAQMSTSGPGFGGAGGQANVDRMRQSQLDVFKRLQSQISGELGNQMKQHQNIVKSIEDQTKKMKELNKTTDEYKKLKEDIKKLQKDEEDSLGNIARLQSQAAQMRGMDNRSFGEMGGFGRLAKAFRGGGFGGLNRAAERMGLGGLAGLAGSAVSGLAGGLGAVGGGMQLLGNFNYMRADLPARQAGREVGIAQGTTQMRGRAIRGENTEDIIFAPERARAIGKTMDFFEDADSARLMRARGKAVAGGAGVLGGMAAGAAIGSAIPVVGTAIGAGLGGLAAGLGIFGGSEEAYYGLTNNKGALSQMTGEEAMQRYETFKLQERMRDPRKYYQKKFFSENRDRLLALQRSGGLDEEEMYGGLGFIQSGAGEFRFNQRAEMANQITAAGGSGSAATRGGLNVLALQAQRSMGLTNAGQSLGRLSSYMNAEESEDAFIRILSKGVSIGLDDSEFREEQKDYFAQVTAIASQIGGGDEMVAAAMAAGVEGDITRRGVQMSADAFQALEGAMNQQGGITAAARAGLISENEAFSGIKGMDRLAFQNMKMQDIEENSDVMRMYYSKSGAREKGISYEDFVNQRQDVQRKALFQAYKGTEIGDRLDFFYKEGRKRELIPEEITQAQEMLKMLPEFSNMNEEQLKRTTKMFLGTERIEERDKAERKRQEELKKQQEQTGIPFAGEEKSFTDQLMGGFGLFDQKAPKKPGEQTLEDRLKTGKGTKIDELERAQAQQQAKQFEKMGENMNEMFSSIMNNLDQTLADQVKMEAFNEALKGGADAVEDFLNALRGTKRRKQAPIKGQNEKTGVINVTAGGGKL